MNVPVSKIMSTNLKTLHPKEKLKLAKAMFEENDIHHIPIEVMGDLRGIISLGDILFLEGITIDSFDEFIKTKKLEQIAVEEVMTRNPYCVDADMMLSDVLDIMTEKRVNALPVNDNNNLVGIVTSYDIMSYFQENLK